MKRDIRIVQHLPHPRDRVWRALTDADALGRWLMPNDFVPELERPFTFRMAPQRGWDGVTHCVVKGLQHERNVAYTYRGAARGDKPIACAGVESERVQALGRGIFAELDTFVRFTLQDEARGTRLLLEHIGFDGLKLVLVSLVMERGWRKMLRRRLPSVLDAYGRSPM